MTELIAVSMIIMVVSIIGLYVAWKILQHIIYKCSHLIAKGIYDAKNGLGTDVTNNNTSIEQSKVNDPLSISEEKIRKDWRKSFFSYYALIPITLIICLIFSLIFNSGVKIDEALIYFSIYVVISCITGFMMYYFAYIRMGTKWIGLFVILSPFGTLADIVKNYPNNIAEWIISIIFIIVYIYFWVHSRRLYHLNHMLRKPDEECAAYILDMQKCENVVELDSMLYRSICNWPQWEKHLSMAHKARKSLLSINTPIE